MKRGLALALAASCAHAFDTSREDVASFVTEMNAEHGFDTADAGMRAAGPTVQFGQRIEHPAAGGPQHTGQGMHPQPLGQLLLGLLGPRGCGGVAVSVVMDLGIVVHVVSSSPRARRVDAAARGLPL